MILHEFKTSNRALMKTPSLFHISWILLASQGILLLVQHIWARETDSEEIITFRVFWSTSWPKPGQSPSGKPRVKARETRKKHQVQREKQAQWCRDGAKSQKPNRYWSWVWSNGCKQDSFGTTAFQGGRISMNTCGLPTGTTDICKNIHYYAVHFNMRHPFRSPAMENRLPTEK